MCYNVIITAMSKGEYRLKKRFIIFTVYIMIGIMLLSSCKAVEQVKEPGSDVDTTVIEPEEKKEETSAAEMPVKQGKVIFDSLKSIFGFANESGDKLITLSGGDEDILNAPAEYNIAIGNNGEIVEIEYEKHQESNEEDNSRENMYNFNNMAGHIYKAKNGSFSQDKTYFLSKDSLFNKDTIISLISLVDNSANDETVRNIEKIKRREITEATLISKTSDGGEIYLIVFERIDDDMLASIVYAKGETVIFKDFPAVYDEMSTWRVDGGDHPGLFEVLFLADSDEGLLLGLAWAGAEGENAFILKSSGDTFKDTDLMCFRCWSPM